MRRFVPDAVRRLRLRAKLAKDLRNASQVWHAYRAGVPPPALQLRNGARIVHRPCDAPVMLFFEIVANGCYRKRLRLREGVVVDVGANIGLFVVDCAFRFPRIRFDAYEPDPETFRTLLQNIGENGLGDRVRAYNEAVGGSCGAAVLSRGVSSIVTTAMAASGDGGAEALKVPMVDLRTVVARSGRIEALKIDVEGAEAEVFEAADVAVLSAIDQIVGEHHDWIVPGTIARIRSRLTAARFSFTLCRDPRCRSLFTARRLESSW